MMCSSKSRQCSYNNDSLLWALATAALIIAIVAILIASIGSGSTTLEGIEAELTGAGGEEVPNGENIVFNTVVNDASNNISYNAVTGVFTITAPGNYLVNWWVATSGVESADRVSLTLRVNGDPFTTVSSPATFGQTSGSALITVNVASATVTLINSSGGDIIFPSTVPVQAGIVITK